MLGSVESQVSRIRQIGVVFNIAVVPNGDSPAKVIFSSLQLLDVRKTQRVVGN